MERIVGEVVYNNEVYEIKYNTDDAEINYRKKGGDNSWYPCCTGPNDDWHIKRNVMENLKRRYG